MISYDEAEKKLAELMKAEMDFYEEHNLDEVIKCSCCKCNSEDELTEEQEKLLEEFECLEFRTRDYLTELASYPEFQGIMDCWTVSITGTPKTEPTQDELKETETAKDIVDLLTSKDPLAKSVVSKVDTWGYGVMECGIHLDGWQVGVVCPTTEMHRLTNMIHLQFSKPVKAGLMKVSVHFSGWKFPTLSSWECVKEYYSLQEDNDE